MVSPASSLGRQDSAHAQVEHAKSRLTNGSRSGCLRAKRRQRDAALSTSARSNRTGILTFQQRRRGSKAPRIDSVFQSDSEEAEGCDGDYTRASSMVIDFLRFDAQGLRRDFIFVRSCSPFASLALTVLRPSGGGNQGQASRSSPSRAAATSI